MPLRHITGQQLSHAVEQIQDNITLIANNITMKKRVIQGRCARSFLEEDSLEFKKVQPEGTNKRGRALRFSG